MGIEPTTSSLGSLRSTTELRPRQHCFSAFLGVDVKRFATEPPLALVLSLSAGRVEKLRCRFSAAML
jgi:hypothetical protein